MIIMFSFVPLQTAHRYLVEKNLSPADKTEFKEQLYRIWFELYARRGSSRWANCFLVVIFIVIHFYFHSLFSLLQLLHYTIKLRLRKQ